MSISRRQLVLGPARELGTVALVAGLCGCYAAVLIMANTVLSVYARHAGGSVGIVLAPVSVVFILIAVYVSAVVITNAVDTVLAGRHDQIALLRLLGAHAASLRRTVMGGTALTGAVGAALGTVLGTAGTHLVRLVLIARGQLPQGDYPAATPLLLVPVLTLAVASAAAGWAGSRSVLQVTPAAAVSDPAAPSSNPRRTSVLRTVCAAGLIGLGVVLLVVAMWLGEHGRVAGFVIVFFGAAVSGTGLLIGARLVIPWLVAGTGGLLGRGPASRVAARNALRDPQRTTRSTMGLVIGVTLVTTFASGMQALQQAVRSWDLTQAQQAQTQQILSTMTAILVAIVVISAVIAAVGFVSTMSLTVIQRRREIGLLRALGFTPRQVRSMISRESAALSGTAVCFGIALGLLYGSAGAQALVGWNTPGFVWGLPWPLLAGIAAASVLLVLTAARPPARRAVRVAPVDALRVT